MKAETVDLAVFERLGEKTLAPLMQSFAWWLHEQATRDGVTQLLFLARDGYMMQAAYLAVIPKDIQIPNRYMYASRRLFNLAAVRRLDESALHFLIGDRAVMSVGRYLERAGLDAAQYSDQIMTEFAEGAESVVLPQYQSNLRRLFLTLEKPILAVAETERRRLKAYADTLVDWDTQTCGVVDIGWHGSLQASLSIVLGLRPEELHGYYLGLHAGVKHSGAGISRAYLDESKLSDFWRYHNTLRRCVELFELFLAEPKGSITGLKERVGGGFGPVRDKQKLPVEIKGGLIAAQKAMIGGLHAGAAGAERREVLREVARLMTRPTISEAQCLGDIPHLEGFGGRGRFEQLARPRYGWREYLLHPRDLVWDLRKTFWRSGFLVRLLH